MTNAEGMKTAVVFDLKNSNVQSIMEDFFDSLTSLERINEPTVSLKEVKQQLLAG